MGYRCCLLTWFLYGFVFSGYDFGYMVKLLTDSRLPEEEHEFFHILNLFFPSIYDVKYLMKSCKNLKVRVSPQQAGDGHQHCKCTGTEVAELLQCCLKTGMCIKASSDTEAPETQFVSNGCCPLQFQTYQCVYYKGDIATAFWFVYQRLIIIQHIYVSYARLFLLHEILHDLINW